MGPTVHYLFNLIFFFFNHILTLNIYIIFLNYDLNQNTWILVIQLRLDTLFILYVCIQIHEVVNSQKPAFKF